MLFSGYLINEGPQKNLTKAERNYMKKKYQKLELIGAPIKHYHQYKIGKDIVLTFSSNRILSMCKNVDWAIQYTPDFVSAITSGNNISPESFLLIPDLSLKALIEIRYLIVCEEVEIYAFYKGDRLYKASVLDNGHLFMSPDFLRRRL